MKNKRISIDSRIAVFTSINRGGTMQLTTELYKQLKLLGYSVNCILPNRASFNRDDVAIIDIHYFERKLLKSKITTVLGEITECNNDIKEVGDFLIRNNYTMVITTDTSSFSIRVVKYLKRVCSEIFTVITVHDAVLHPSYNASLKSKYYYWSSNHFRERCLVSADSLLFLSSSNMAIFKKTYPNINCKLVCMPLGAHIPNVHAMKPTELNQSESGYFLFFGRLEKYKCVGDFLKAYNEYKESKCEFVIAGNGTLTDEEKKLISSNDKVVLIQRYISDEEMVWLFENSKASVLPYIEASQSGIIPISYYYSKPVITSNIQGLTQFVENGSTGIICNSKEDYINAMKAIEDDKIYESMSLDAKNYYDHHLNWGNNLKEAINNFNDIIGKI